MVETLAAIAMLVVILVFFGIAVDLARRGK